MCTCNQCKYILNAKLEKRSEEERVHQFLMGLDETSCSTIRSNIIATDPLPNMYRVYSQVTEQEQEKAMTRSIQERSHSVGFAVKTTNTDLQNTRGIEGMMEPFALTAISHDIALKGVLN